MLDLANLTMTNASGGDGAASPPRRHDAAPDWCISGHVPHIAASPVAPASARSLRIGLIDCYQFSRECLVRAFDVLQPRFTMLPFPTVRDCILNADQMFDLVLYHAHSSETESLHNISMLLRSLSSVPLIVLSDAEDAHQPETICSTLQQGAQGFIPTRTMGIPMIVAAIRLVEAGGTFAPLDLLFKGSSPVPEPKAAAPAPARQDRLTSRQIIVLRHLQQGKANKIIAHELGMSESTVKVHVRNIMRKMGATNRTQAVYKAQSVLRAQHAGGC